MPKSSTPRMSSTGRPHARRSRDATRRRCRPGLEAMEGRTLLSTLTVTSAADGGKGSLRDAITAASPGDTIAFASKLKARTITLLSPLSIAQDLTIQGPGREKLTVSGGGNGRVFLVTAGSLTISGLTITGGRVSAPDQGLIYAAGGGLLNTGGTVTLAHDRLIGDTVAYAAGLAAGGAVANVGANAVMTLTGTEVGGDEASGLYAEGGGVLNADGGTLTIDAGTFSGDVALAGNFAVGGAVGNDGGSTLTVDGTSFLNNLAQDTLPLPPAASYGARRGDQ